MWARERCRISPPRFLAECCKTQLNHGSFVLLYFRLSTFSDLYWVRLSVFSCTVLFVSISQVIGCEDRLRNDLGLYCVEWGVKLYSNQPTSYVSQQRGTARICCWAPCCWPSRGRRCRSISRRTAGHTAANPPHAAAAVDRRDRQTYRQTDGHRTVTQSLPHTMRAV